ncbi:MAG: 26S protease regulatory subunit [Planctomycetes bacterium]|nr:26S protease regulatory subunit [Planctomycetota bacterium]
MPNLDAALEAFGREPGTTLRRVGWVPQEIRGNPPLVGLVGRRRGGAFDDEGLPVGPVEERDYPVAADRDRPCLVHGVRLIARGARKTVALVRMKETYFSDASPLSLEIATRDRAAADELLDFVKRHAARHSVYRGSVISLDLDRLGRPNGEGDQLGIQFHAFPEVPAADLVLPAAVRAVLVQNTLTFVARRPALLRAGQDQRRGLLFHGPPGTGKTLAVRYLTRALPGHTTLLVAGENLYHVAAHFRLARILAPTLLVFEDVDLIAEERGSPTASLSHTFLNSLLNEMDGLKGDAEITVVLTTNRPDTLEPALAARPGRIDQAIEFPLPDAECRRRLFAVHGRGLDVHLAREAEWIDRTEGASPAFIKELFRRAAVEAAGAPGLPAAGGDGAPADAAGAGAPGLRVGDRELEVALRELTLSGGGLTQRLLGFGSDRAHEGRRAKA